MSLRDRLETAVRLILFVPVMMLAFIFGFGAIISEWIWERVRR